MTKTQAISKMILAKIAEGFSVREALDEVLGAGASEALISEVYETLRASRGRGKETRYDRHAKRSLGLQGRQIHRLG